MKRWLRSILDINIERSIWIDQQELGTEKIIEQKNNKYCVKIPQNIGKRITLRLNGLGKRRGKRVGDLLLHIWLNKGDDIWKNLWLSEISAKKGDRKILLLDDKNIQMVIPKNSYNGLVIRLKGLGQKPDIKLRDPNLILKSGDLLVKLIIYSVYIVPTYGSFDMLDTDDMVLEGWVYRKIDEIRNKLGTNA